MTALLTQMIEILVSGITGIATGIGGGLNALATSIFLVEGAEGVLELSTFGGLVLCFGGISLAVGLSRYVVNWLSSLGN